MKITVQNSQSILNFSTTGGGYWPVWDRFISIDGKDAFHIGNICGTCAFFFARMDGANRSINPRKFQDELSIGINALKRKHAKILSELLPDGVYELRLIERIPKLVAPGEPRSLGRIHFREPG